MNVVLLLSSLCLIAGGLLLVAHVLSTRRPSLPVRLARARGEIPETVDGSLAGIDLPESWRARAERISAGYEQRLRRAARSESVAQLIAKKLLFCLAAPLVPLLPYSVAVQHAPSLVLVVLLAVIGFFIPDLVLRSEINTRREAIFLDLPEAIAVMALSLRAGQSLRQALQLAGRDCQGPLGQELGRALSLARRDRALEEREALITVAEETGEPTLIRFAELLAAKESPYVEFLREQARQIRGEQNRWLERAADRAHIAMHAPLVPLLAVLVLVLAYGLIHFLAQTV